MRHVLLNPVLGGNCVPSGTVTSATSAALLVQAAGTVVAVGLFPGAVVGQACWGFAVTQQLPTESSGQMTRQPDYALYEDDQVTFYYDTLPKGTYDFYFRLKTTFEGSFVHPAAKAELMYKQTIYGNSNGTRIVIGPRKD